MYVCVLCAYTCARVPERVCLCMHECYGLSRANHFPEPDSTTFHLNMDGIASWMDWTHRPQDGRPIKRGSALGR